MAPFSCRISVNSEDIKESHRERPAAWTALASHVGGSIARFALCISFAQ